MVEMHSLTHKVLIRNIIASAEYCTALFVFVCLFCSCFRLFVFFINKLPFNSLLTFRFFIIITIMILIKMMIIISIIVIGFFNPHAFLLEGGGRFVFCFMFLTHIQ